MTVNQLINMLEEYDGDTEVKIMVDGKDHDIDCIGDIGSDDYIIIADSGK